MTTDEFEDLVYKYLDGQTTPAEAAELNRQLKADPALADFFVRITKNEAWVQAHHAVESPFDEKRPAPRVRRPLPPRRRAPAFLPFAIAAALLLGFLAILYFASSTAEAPGPVVQKKPPRPDPRVEMVQIQEESRQAQKRLAEVQAPKPEQPKQKVEEERRQAVAELQRIEERRKEVEQVIERTAPEPPRPATAVAVATVQRAEGSQVLLPGQEVSNAATIVYPDGTKVELGSETTVRDVPGKGKGLFVAKGAITAEVVKQEQPMVFATPQGEARVLGTQLSLLVADSTRLDVKEGKVRFTKPDGKSIDVTADHYTVAAPGAELKLLSSRVALQTFAAQPVFASAFDAPWGKPAKWAGLTGALQGSRSDLGSSARVLVVPVPPHTTVELSARMRCPKAAGGFWMELAARPGEHTAEDFDTNSAAWTLVKKFDSYSGPNGNANVWSKYSKQIPTGTATKLTIGFKLGSTAAGDYSAAWDSVRITY
ncbi:MAG: FecR domain-containing protein [Planctomycetes bacterium]|nr:FecR domain-containing protein [Planctomycetota bacterium]